jgi:hypothetical protein
MRYAVVLLPFVIFAAPARAQLITIRTLPMSQGDQFDIFPSNNLGMAGLSIAMPDTLLDPFRNPATAARVSSRFFTSPGVYSVSGDAGAGRTLPLGAFLRRERWFGTVALAVQQVDASRQNLFFPPILDSRPVGFPPSSAFDISRGTASHGNIFALATVGRELPGKFAIAGSISWVRLRAVDGVDMMYQNAQAVDQAGHSFDARLGLLKTFTAGSALQAVVVHNRYAMTHNVTYLDTWWDPATQQQFQRPRQELNADQTNTWGAHLEYALPLAPGWRLGWVATANTMSHPKIPDYTIMNIPHDPGTSNAYDVGIGLSQRDGPATFGIELVHEPIWSHTWADATAPTATTTNDTIPVGGRTIENRFHFANDVFRVGFGRNFSMGAHDQTATLQLGLVVRRNSYRMTQDNRLDGSVRREDQSWTEWTPTWGLAFAFPEFEIRYRGSVTNGGSRPGVSSCGGCVFAPDGGRGGDIVVAPNGPMNLGPVSVVSHQVSVAVPLRRARAARSAEQ